MDRLILQSSSTSSGGVFTWYMTQVSVHIMYSITNRNFLVRRLVLHS